MATHSGRLTKRVIAGWDRDGILWDGELKGFGVRANTDGGMSYIVNYRNRHNKSCRYTIGKASEALTPDQARAKARNLLSRVQLEGFDPQGHRLVEREALRVNDVIDRYLESARFAQKAATTQYTDRGRLERHIRPLLGSAMAESLTPEHIRRAFAAIRDGKTAGHHKTKPRGVAHVRGGEGAARMAIRVLRAIFSWAITERLMSSNPAAGVHIGADGVRDAILDGPEQYAALFRALDVLAATRRIPGAAADAIRVLALTGARRNEVAAARWCHVDLKRGILALPAKAHKAGHKSGKPKHITLNAAAQAIIARRPDGAPDDYVFPPTRGAGPITLGAGVWRLIRQTAGLPDGIGNHSLRHSLGTLMAIQGAEAAEIMATLGHTQLSTTARYIHFGKDARAALMERHTAGISALLDGKPAAVVIDLRDAPQK